MAWPNERLCLQFGAPGPAPLTAIVSFKKLMKRSQKSLPKQKTFDGYLAALSKEKRAALEKLREAWV